MKIFLRLVFSAFLFFAFSSSAFAQKAVPELWGQRIHDEARILLPTTIDQLEKKLKVYEDSTSNQIAVLIIQSLDGDAIENYSIRVAEKWKLGQKGKDNGVLLLIAVDDHKMRIEVGQGLEGALTDAKSSRIIRNDIAPAFRRNDFDDGITTGIESIIKVIGGEYTADYDGETFKYTLSIIFIILILVPTIFAFIKELTRSKSGSVSTVTSGARSNSWSSSSSSSISFSGGGGSFGGGGSSGSW
jgi:uncharacterized protein